jgi:uncharacterized protein (TIGR02231 family)
VTIKHQDNYNILFRIFIETMGTVLETEITKVTVYLDRAQITRQGIITLDGSESLLSVLRLPATIDPASIRVSGRGASPVKILAVTTEVQRFKEPVKQKLSEVEAQIENLETNQQKLKARIATAQMQSEFISGLKTKAEDTFPTSLARQKMSLGEIVSFIDDIGNKFTDYAFLVEDYRLQMLELDKQMNVLKARHKSFNTAKSTESLQVSVEIEPESAGQFQLELSYTVEQASWNPLYDLRVDTVKQQLQLTYLAQIKQKTGEDWTDVSLSLSTAQPGLGTIPPQLSPWYIDNIPSGGMVGASGRTGAGLAMAAGGSSETILRRRATAFENSDDFEPIEAESSVAKRDQQGSSVTFHLQGSGNIPSDGSPRKTTILRDEFPCQLNYVAMPKLVSFAYLRAQVQNPSDGATLLHGVGNIFCDDLFVGNVNLKHIAPGQIFDINLGIDERISIDRELVERQVDKKFLGSNRRITCAYRLNIQNLRSIKVKLNLTEQIPHSLNEKIKVRLIKSEPTIAPRELGQIEWDLEFAANESRIIYYQFVVEHPEDVQLSGFRL